MTKMLIDRAVAEQALHVATSAGYPVALIAALRAALAEPCPCGDRPKDQCPGEWEPGCDLGNNPTYAKRVNLAEPVQEPVAVHQFRKRGSIDWFDGHPDHTDGGGPYVSRTLYLDPPQRPAEPVQEPTVTGYGTINGRKYINNKLKEEE